MRIFPENFECLHFTEARYGAPKVTEDPTATGKVITIPVRNLPVQRSVQGVHPLIEGEYDKSVRRHPALGCVVDGLLVFRGVFMSKREMDEYIGDPANPDGFKDEYVIRDVDLPLGGEVLKVYPFEGIIEEPNAWVTWDIIARSFELQVE